MTVPTAAGVTTISREGTEQGSPDQAFPKYKAIAILDWTLGEFGASLTGRYIKSVRETEADGNKLNSRFYTDVQLRWIAPSFADDFGFALGVNNLFDKDPPACISCGLNNFDPTHLRRPGPLLLRPRLGQAVIGVSAIADGEGRSAPRRSPFLMAAHGTA